MDALRDIRRALRSPAGSDDRGGRLVIVDRWFDKGQEENSGRLSTLLSKSLRDPEFYLKSLPEFLASLERIGLETKPDVELTYYQWKLIVSQKTVPEKAEHRDCLEEAF